MGTSHFTSNVVGNVSIAVNSMEATTMKTRSYFQAGSHVYMLFGSANNEAAVVAAATAVDASCRGSIYFSRPTTTASPCEIYYLRSDTAASKVQDIAA